MFRGKRKHYTDTEKKSFEELLKKFPEVHEKKTDAATLKRKDEAWERICAEFNSSADHVPVQYTLIL